MKNKDKIVKIVKIVKDYVINNLGEDTVVSWNEVKEDDNNLKVELKKGDKTLSFYTVCFLKTKWGIGFGRDGSFGWSFNYTNKIVNDLLNNKDFEYGMKMWVFDNFNKA